MQSCCAHVTHLWQNCCTACDLRGGEQKQHATQGVFCGDCLFMRYGENILEVQAASAWECPPCRGLCNCSFHRIRRGWAPTGTLYRRAIAEGALKPALLHVQRSSQPALLGALQMLPSQSPTGTLYRRAVAEGALAAALQHGVPVLSLCMLARAGTVWYLGAPAVHNNGLRSQQCLLAFTGVCLHGWPCSLSRQVTLGRRPSAL